MEESDDHAIATCQGDFDNDLPQRIVERDEIVEPLSEARRLVDT